jgi:hypothetical protein
MLPDLSLPVDQPPVDGGAFGCCIQVAARASHPAKSAAKLTVRMKTGLGTQFGVEKARGGVYVVLF